ncbi:hypothetical protein F5Y14DRAFT_448459 [Nemania sp. NC0429]|nr:hypothetical protein F5Y14DRAFT_448459 [Nemania sp. NC0429]
MDSAERTSTDHAAMSEDDKAISRNYEYESVSEDDEAIVPEGWVVVPESVEYKLLFETFPQFNQLPYELRHEILENFGLPRGPLLHVFSHRIFEGSPPTLHAWTKYGPAFEPNMFRVFRALAQVSSEARIAVLAGRQLERLGPHTRWTNTGTADGPPLPFFYANWAIDMVLFSGLDPLWVDFDPPQDWMNRVERFATSVRVLSHRHRTLSVAGRGCISWDLCRGILAQRLPNFKSFYLVLCPHDIRDLYVHMLKCRTDRSRRLDVVIDWLYDYDEEKPLLEDEDAVPKLDGLSDCLFDYRRSRDYNLARFLGNIPLDQWGFHELGPESAFCLEGTLRCFDKSRQDNEDRPFLDWVNQVVSSVKRKLEGLGRPDVDVKMVLDAGRFWHWFKDD